MNNQKLILIVAAVVFTVFYLGIGAGYKAYAQDPNSVLDPNSAPVIEPNQPTEIAEPNEPVEPNQPAPAPRQIVMPKGTKLPPPPVRYRCPRHGVIADSLLTLEYEGVKYTYCKKCAIKFLIDVFDLNLPKLEIVE